MSDTLIKVEGLSKKFCRSLKKSLWYGMQDLGNEMIGKRHGGNGELRTDEFWAVKDVNFELRRGECLGLIGHNGAGKTTLLRILNGLIKPDGGRVELQGTVGALIALGAGFNPVLTGRENIYVNAAVLGMDKQYVDSKIDEIIDFAEISEFINSPVQTYSSGMNVRLGFAIAAILTEPDILLIDEVLAVGDLGFVIKCLNRVGELIPKTATIFVSHSMPMMARISTKTMLMNRGIIDFYSNDIAEGITQYIDLFKAPERINQGTGEIELLRIGIKDTLTNKFKHDETVVLKTFDDLIIQVELELKHSVADFALFITTFDGQLREALSSSSASTCEPFSNKSDNIRTFEIKIPKLVLATGRYSMTFGAIDSNTKQFYCRVTNSVHFIMKAIKMTWATSYVPGEWKELKTIGLDESLTI
jgi:lipopolysaccharide transport system ATP-binding protein